MRKRKWRTSSKWIEWPSRQTSASSCELSAEDTCGPTAKQNWWNGSARGGAETSDGAIEGAVPAAEVALRATATATGTRRERRLAAQPLGDEHFALIVDLCVAAATATVAKSLNWRRRRKLRWRAMWPSSGDGENVAFGGGGVHAALCPIAADSRELEKVEEVERSAELEAAAEAVGARRREEPNAAVREVGEQQRDG